MKNLILIRHAKSSWEIPLKDIDRPLSGRGINDAHLIASKIKDSMPKSFLVWCSSAKRTRETALIFSQNLSFLDENITIKDGLYTFDAEKLEEIINKCENKYDNLIIFGHNEAITKFVNKFGNLLIDNVPTSGVVSLQLDIKNWKNLKKGKTTNTFFPSYYKHEQHKSEQIY
uniref:SixA phosphatase family protein n=1 Tax=Flavobacterium sp. TaxID=239 RepID=UPI00404A4B0F